MRTGHDEIAQPKSAVTAVGEVTQRPPACPFCGELERTELVSQFGGQLITAQWHCAACNSYFEALRRDFDAPTPAAGNDGE